jgi:hypothetical protein
MTSLEADHLLSKLMKATSTFMNNLPNDFEDSGFNFLIIFLVFKHMISICQREICVDNQTTA